MSIYRIADLRLDAGRRELSRDGHPIELGKLTYSLFLELVTRAPNVVTHDELVARVWGGRATSPETVTQRVKMLRDALGDDAEKPRYVALVRGHGYRLIVVAEVMDAPEAVSTPASHRSSQLGIARRRYAFLGVGTFIVLATATGLSFVRDRAPLQSAVVPKLAVLPCENLGPDPNDAEFAAGLHSELLYRLDKLSGLSLISRMSVSAFADPATRPPVAEIADRLDARYILECSVRRAGDEIVVAVELIDPATDVTLFPARYRADLNDIASLFAVQSDIATRITNALKIGYSPKEHERIAHMPTESRDAYALYLRARDLGNREAIPLFKEAIVLDEDFALAHGALAWRYALSLANSPYGPVEPVERWPELSKLAREHAERAIELDTDVPDAYTALVLEAAMFWRWTEADAAFAKAMELAPSTSTSSGAWQVHMTLLAAQGRHDEAIALATHAREIDPGNGEAGYYGFALGYAGRYAEAAEALEEAIDAAPTNPVYRHWLAFMQVAMGNPEAAIQQLEVAEQLAVGDYTIRFLGPWAYAWSRAGRPSDAARFLRMMEDAASAGMPAGAGAWAMAYLAVGDEARALEWLEIAAEKAANHEPDEDATVLVALKTNVTNDPVLRQPEFVDVMSRIRGD
jgi:TolB-like protein/DNA-binding winged helix-turn-helix (wHTH) protein/thioredoxin-like negative regulator of GroEL